MSEYGYLAAVLATEAGDVQHHIHVFREGTSRYRAKCACGGYRSKTYFFPGLAEAAGWDHAKALNASRSVDI